MSKKIFLFGFIGISILFAGCTKQVTTEDNSNTFLTNYNNLQSSYKLDDSLNQCMSDSLNKCMGSIVTSKARESMDESICNDLKNEDLKTECIGSIKFIQAIQETDINKCSELSGKLLYNCEIDILNLQAQKELDKSLCEKIIPDSGIIVSDPSVGLLYSGARNICIDNVTSSIAINNLDTSICDDIVDSGVKEYCEDKVATMISAEVEMKELEKIESERLEPVEENSNGVIPTGIG